MSVDDRVLQLPPPLLLLRAREHQFLEGEVGGGEVVGGDEEVVDGAGGFGQDDGLVFHLVGAVPGGGAGITWVLVNGTVGIRVHGRIGRHDGLLFQDECVRGAECQGDGGLLRAHIGQEHLVGGGPAGIGELGFPGAQQAAGGAEQDDRDQGKQVSHRIGFLQI